MFTLMLAALLTFFGPCESVRRITADQSHIDRLGTAAAAQYAVPPAVLMSVGFYETWLGTYPGEGGNWGAPASRFHRHVAGTPADAARALARSFSVCGSWEGAIGRFRSGECTAPHNRGYVRHVLAMADRLNASAGVSTPERWRLLTARRP